MIQCEFITKKKTKCKLKAKSRITLSEYWDLCKKHFYLINPRKSKYFWDCRNDFKS
jgi:hypothetical protein